MRRSFAILIILLIPSALFAADANWGAEPVTCLQGRHGAAKAYTFTDNVAVSASTMYVTGWSDTTYGQPIGLTVSVETQDARFSCGGGTPTTGGLGHLLAAGSSREVMTSAPEDCKFIPKTAGSYPLIQINPIYSK